MHRRTAVYFLVVVKCSSAFRIVIWILQFSKCVNLRIYYRNAENSRTAHEGKLIPCYWCVKSLDQNTSWVIVGYPRWRFIRTRSLVNCLSFLRNEQVVPDGFESLYERFRTRRDASWKTYARKGQEKCNYSYRLSKTELRSGLHRPFSLLFVFFIPRTIDSLYFAKWCRRSVAFLIVCILKRS